MADSLSPDQVTDLRAVFQRYRKVADDDDDDDGNNSNNSDDARGDDENDGDDDDGGYDEANNGAEIRERGYLDRTAWQRAMGDIDLHDDDGNGPSDMDNEACNGLFDNANWNGDDKIRWDAYVEVLGSRFGAAVEDQEREILRQFRAQDTAGDGTITRKGLLAALEALGEDVSSMGFGDNDDESGGGSGGGMGNKSESLESGDMISFADFAAMYGLSERAQQSYMDKNFLKRKEEVALGRAERKAAKLSAGLEKAMAHFLPLAREAIAALSTDDDSCCLCLDPLNRGESVVMASATTATVSSTDAASASNRKIEDASTAAVAPSGEGGEKNTQPSVTAATTETAARSEKKTSNSVVVMFPHRCKHLFHQSCIEQVVQHQLSKQAAQLSCPMCQSTFDLGAAPPAVASSGGR